MFGKLTELEDFADSINESTRSLEWLIENIEEKVNGAKGCTEDAITQLREIIGDNDIETKKISVEIEDLLALMQTLDDTENELNEL